MTHGTGRDGIGESCGDRGYTCLTLEVPGLLADAATQLCGLIDPCDLGGKGLEEDTHITVCYGIHTTDPEAVREVIRDSGLESIWFRVGGLSLFENEDADVLKADVDSDDLAALNALVRARLEVTSGYDEYHPHITIAYLRPGTGTKYCRSEGYAGAWFESTSLTMSSPSREKHFFDLGDLGEAPAWPYVTPEADCCGPVDYAPRLLTVDDLLAAGEATPFP